MATINERNIIESSYGLKTDLMFPLRHETDITKAIKFFMLCPVGRRNELSLAINNFAKKLDKNYLVAKDSIFMKYADRRFFKEPEVGSFMHNVIKEHTILEVSSCLDKVSHELRSAVTLLINRANLSEEKDFLNLDSKVASLLNETSSELLSSNGDVNYVTHINSAMQKLHDVFYEFLEYTDPESDYKGDVLLSCVLDDIFLYMKNSIELGLSPSLVDEKIKLLDSLTANYKVNSYYLSRRLLEISIDCRIKLRLKVNLNNMTEYENVAKVIPLVNDYINYLQELPSSGFNNSVLSIMNLVGTLDKHNFPTNNCTRYLTVMKNEIKSEIDIILMAQNMNRLGRDSSMEFMTDVVDPEHRDIVEILRTLEGSIKKYNVKLYNKTYSLCLTPSHIVSFNELGKFERMYVGKDAEGDNVYYGINRDSLYLLACTGNVGEVLHLKLYDGRQQLSPISNLTCNRDDFQKDSSLKAIRSTLKTTKKMVGVTEGLSFTEDGGVKFTFKPKKSYMDEYAENHKLLVENQRSQNYDGMKTNLAFLFELINSIERQVYSKKIINAEVKKDAEKARMFATNDFKTYLRVVQKNEPKFNFTEYYAQSDYGKIVVGVKRDDIVGIRRLFQTIILS